MHAELSRPDSSVSDAVRAFGPELQSKLAALGEEHARCQETKRGTKRMFGISGSQEARSVGVASKTVDMTEVFGE